MRLIFLASFVLALIYSVEGQAARIVKVKGGKALIKLGKLRVKKGELLVVVNRRARAQGLLRVIKTKGSGAIAKVVKGNPQAGGIVINKSKYLRIRRKQKLRDVRRRKTRRIQEEPEEDMEPEPQPEEESEPEKRSSSSPSNSKSINIRTNPLSAAVGFINIDGEMLFLNLSLGVSFQTLSATIDSVDVEGTMIGVRGNYFFDGPSLTTNSWYLGLGGGVIDLDMSQSTSLGNAVGSLDGTYLLGMVGYVWAWDWFNLWLGAGGIQFSLSSDKVTGTVGASNTSFEYDAPLSGFAPLVELNLGIAF